MFPCNSKTNDFDEMNHRRALAIILKDNSKMSCHSTGRPVEYSKLSAIIPFISFLFCNLKYDSLAQWFPNFVMARTPKVF